MALSIRAITTLQPRTARNRAMYDVIRSRPYASVAMLLRHGVSMEYLDYMARNGWLMYETR